MSANPFGFDVSKAWVEGSDWAFHERQFSSPYQSTIAFRDFLDQSGVIPREAPTEVLDVGAGMGGVIWFLSRHFPHTRFTGLELSAECVERGNTRLAELNSSNCQLVQGDMFACDPSMVGRFEGIISLATLSWLPEFNPAMECLLRLEPRWVAATSLFYDGPVDATIKTSDYSRPVGESPCTEKFYNVYSLPRVRQFFHERGYAEFHAMPFPISIDLPKPEHGGMGTYTERLADGRRLQISGPVLMNWYMILAEKS